MVLGPVFPLLPALHLCVVNMLQVQTYHKLIPKDQCSQSNEPWEYKYASSEKAFFSNCFMNTSDNFLFVRF